MPARTNEFATTLCHSPSQAYNLAKGTLLNDPRSNILLPTLEKACEKERRGILPQTDEFWIILHTTSNPTQVDFVLSCTSGVVGKYPIFIFSRRFENELHPDFLEPRMYQLVRKLTNAVSSRRVYSVFAVQPVSGTFARHWSEATGIASYSEPYYDSWFSFCTSNTLAGALQNDPSLNIRLAVEGDIRQVASLCKGFSEESFPFVLNDCGALEEATKLVQAGQLWVLEYRHSQGTSIGCIVALTRSNATVTAITKVYTPSEARQRGYARRLVREVCSQLLFTQRKSCVVLYVGKTNPAANVYYRVGFQGLPPARPEDFSLVEPWTEIGFDRTKVNLGQW